MEQNRARLITGKECVTGCGVTYVAEHGHPVVCATCWTARIGEVRTIKFNPPLPATIDLIDGARRATLAEE